METLLKSTRQHIVDADAFLVDWASGGVLADRAVSHTASWPLSSLESVLLVSFGYLFTIFLFASIMRSIYGTKDAERVLGKSIKQKLTDEPIVAFQLVYNAIQVAFCGYMVYEAAHQFILRGFGSPFCNSFEPTEEKSLGMAKVLYIFYLTKVLDFLDTIFMVARRKWKQLSFLHLYHHTTIFIIYWLIAQAGYDGDIYFTVIANGIIHFIMYSYYFVRTLNIQVPTLFKMAVTNAQLIQFVCMNAQALYLLVNKECAYPRNLTWYVSLCSV